MSEVTLQNYLLTSPVEAAIKYAESGWAVLPCHVVLPNSGGCTCGLERCASPGKHPVVRRGLHSASKKLDVVRSWWQRWPKANVAVRTGRESGIVVLDVDPAHGGLDSLRRLTNEHESLPQTYVVGTGSDGLHFYFTHPGHEVRNIAGSKLGPGLDIRGDGGYVIAPPSIHASGHPYHVAADLPLAAMPDWMVERLREPQRERVVSVPDVSTIRSSRWAQAAVAGELRLVQHAGEGTRNDTLNRAAFNLGQIVGSGLLSEIDVTDRLLQAGMSIGLSERECVATVTSGLRAGRTVPRSAQRADTSEVSR